MKWRRKTKRLHRLTFGLLLGLVEAASGYAWLALALHGVCIGIVVHGEGWLRLPFFVPFLKFLIFILFHIAIIWYICSRKT